MVTNFQFRLNGIIIPHLVVRPVLIDGMTDRWELVANHDKLGEFAIDDNEGFADPALTPFILEVRDASIPPIERRFLPNKGWRRISTKECFTLLESAGVIDPQYEEAACSQRTLRACLQFLPLTACSSSREQV